MIPNLVKALDINNERELLLKLPINHKQIFVSKMIVSYLYEVIFATAILLPILVAYGLATDMHWGFYIYFPLLLVFIPVIPFFVSSLLIFPVTKIVHFMKNRPTLTSIGYLCALVGAIFLYMYMIGNVMDAIVDTGNFRDTLYSAAPRMQHIASNLFPINLFANLIDSSIGRALGSFFAIVGISIALLTLSYFIAGGNYKRTYMNETSSHVSINRRASFKQRSPIFATFKKDVLNIGRSSNYTFQFLLLVIITPFVLFFISRIAINSSIIMFNFDDAFDFEANENMIFGLSKFILLILLPLACAFAASNITREGDNIYHTKLIPQSFINQLGIKVGIILIPIIVSVFSSVMLLRIPYAPESLLSLGDYRFQLNWTDSIYILITSTLMAIGYICLGTYLDLRNPLCKQVGGGELTKSTRHINYVMVLGLIIGAVVGIFTLIGSFESRLPELMNIPRWIEIIFSIGSSMRTTFFVFSIIFGLGAALLLFLHGPRIYRRLEQ